MWFCHATCFKERLGSLPAPENEGFFDPAHF
jgi:hypothetical protein